MQRQEVVGEYLWVFCCREGLEDYEKVIGEWFSVFFAGWEDHGFPLRGWWMLAGGGKLVVVHAVKEGSSERIDGCAHDELFAVVKELERRLCVRLTDRGWVPCEVGGEVVLVRPYELAEKVARGELSADTPVYDIAVTTLAEWRRQPVPLRASRYWRLVKQQV